MKSFHGVWCKEGYGLCRCCFFFLHISSHLTRMVLEDRSLYCQYHLIDNHSSYISQKDMILYILYNIPIVH
ncbi:hypothetical protein Hanom_Chr14g01246951 [Helianthus anomalus]